MRRSEEIRSRIGQRESDSAVRLWSADPTRQDAAGLGATDSVLPTLHLRHSVGSDRRSSTVGANWQLAKSQSDLSSLGLRTKFRTEVDDVAGYRSRCSFSRSNFRFPPISDALQANVQLTSLFSLPLAFLPASCYLIKYQVAISVPPLQAASTCEPPFASADLPACRGKCHNQLKCVVFGIKFWG